MIDLRSDTVTQPTDGMRAAMAAAEVGDDVLDVDPTLDALEREVAELLGKERALFMPSGTMTNQVALRVHCQPGDEFVCEEGAHIYNYEQGGFAQLSGLAARPVRGDHGVLTTKDVVGLVRPDNEHFVRTRLLTLENTHNRAGGRVQPLAELQSLCQWARDQGLRTHLDGARLMNAVAATGIEAAVWSRDFDTVSLCFSKGLGAPVGSILAGSGEDMHQARRHRKLFGGGMRQAGVLAAAAQHALTHHVELLALDHAKAQQLAQTVRDAPGCRLASPHVETNMVLLELEPRLGTAATFVQSLAELDVYVLAVGPQTIRLVTHLDVSEAQVGQACAAIAQVAVAQDRAAGPN